MAVHRRRSTSAVGPNVGKANRLMMLPWDACRGGVPAMMEEEQPDHAMYGNKDGGSDPEEVLCRCPQAAGETRNPGRPLTREAGTRTQASNAQRRVSARAQQRGRSRNAPEHFDRLG